MAEDKKTPVPGPVPGQDLTSKIATAFRSMPANESKRSPEEVEVENPELDKAFDKLVDMYKVRRPERENAVVSFPAPPTLRVPKSEPAPSGEEYECPECGHDNPAGNQFCGMCGAAREDAAPSEPMSRPESEQMAGTAPLDNAKHHHHYYHHHHYRNNPYLLLAVALLLGMIAWQQWQAYKQQTSSKPAAPVAPAVQSQPAAPEQSQATPTNKPASQTPPAAPARSTQPLKKPAQTFAQPRVMPIRQGEPPGTQAKLPDTGAPQVSAPFSYRPLTQQPLPTLPSFSATPTKPVTPQPRLTLSQEVSAGRLIKQVPPTFPAMAKRAGVQGEVILRTVIAKDGSVQDVSVVSGDPLLAEAAVQAVRQWRYQPSTLNGQPVEAETLVQVRFKR